MAPGKNRRSILGSAYATSAATFQSTQSFSIRSYDRQYNKTQFKRDIVFSAPFHVNYNSARDKNDTSQADTNFGVVYSKYRKFVVINCFEHHFVALPIFTHNSQGLEGKPREEYISVRDRDDSAPFPAESTHGVLFHVLTDASLTGGFHSMKLTKPSIHVVQPHCYRYNTKIVISGKLEEESTQKLWKLFKELFLGESDEVTDDPEETTPRQPIFKPGVQLIRSTASQRQAMSTISTSRSKSRPSLAASAWALPAQQANFTNSANVGKSRNSQATENRWTNMKTSVSVRPPQNLQTTQISKSGGSTIGSAVNGSSRLMR